MEQLNQKVPIQEVDPSLQAPQPVLVGQAEALAGAIDGLAQNSQISSYLNQTTKGESQTNGETLRAGLSQAFQAAEQGQIGRATLISGNFKPTGEVNYGEGLPNLRDAFLSLKDLSLTSQDTSYGGLFSQARPAVKMNQRALAQNPGGNENDQAYADAAALIADGQPYVMTSNEEGEPFAKLFGVKDPATGEPLKNVLVEVWSSTFKQKDIYAYANNMASAKIVVLPNRLVDKAGAEEPAIAEMPARTNPAAELRANVAGTEADGSLLQVLASIEESPATADLSDEQRDKLEFDYFVGTLIGLGDVNRGGKQSTPADSLRDVHLAARDWSNKSQSVTRYNGLRAAVQALASNPGTAELLESADAHTVNENGRLIPSNLDQLDAYLNAKGVNHGDPALRRSVLREANAYAHTPDFQATWDYAKLAESGVDVELIKQSAEAMRKKVAGGLHVGHTAVAKSTER